MKYYVVFAPPEIKGIYKSWPECRAVIDGCPGVSYCSYKTEELANSALKAGSLVKAKAVEAREKACLWKKVVKMPCIAVDAACSGCPGPVEYRGVFLPDGFEVFRRGPYESGTNNIGEFLGVVAGLKWLESTSLNFDLYTDSATAIKWVKTLGYCNTKLENVGRELSMEIKLAESWLKKPASLKYMDRIRKWDTREWGEIPADYGKK